MEPEPGFPNSRRGAGVPAPYLLLTVWLQLGWLGLCPWSKSRDSRVESFCCCASQCGPALPSSPRFPSPPPRSPRARSRVREPSSAGMVVMVRMTGGEGEGRREGKEAPPKGRAGEGAAEEGSRDEAERALRTSAEETGSAERGLGPRRRAGLPLRGAASSRGGAAGAPGPVPPGAEAAQGAGATHGRERGGRPSCHLQPLRSGPPPPAAGARLPDKPQRETH